MGRTTSGSSFLGTAPWGTTHPSAPDGKRSPGARFGTSPSATEAANASIGPPPSPPMPPLLPPQPPLRRLRVDLICCCAAAAATVVAAAAATAAIHIRMAHGTVKDGARATAIACECTLTICCVRVHPQLQTCCHRDTAQPPTLSNRSSECRQRLSGSWRALTAAEIVEHH